MEINESSKRRKQQPRNEIENNHPGNSNSKDSSVKKLSGYVAK